MMTLQKWTLQACNVPLSVCPSEILKLANLSTEEVFTTEHIAQVHSILLNSGRISDQVIENGDASDCGWVAQSDWTYRSSFSINDIADMTKSHLLSCKGLETVCDIFVNDVFLGRSISHYIPFEMKIDHIKKAENKITIVFHRYEKLREYYKDLMLEHWRGNVPVEAMLRRRNDYGSYINESRGFSPIGITNEVNILEYSTCELKSVEIDTKLERKYQYVDIQLSITGANLYSIPSQLHVAIRKKNGCEIICDTQIIIENAGEWKKCLVFRLDNPELWWPKNYGDQNMYEAVVELLSEGEETQTIIKPFGVRTIRLVGNMCFEVNGVQIRFWGGNIVPLCGHTNVFDVKSSLGLVEMIDQAGMNAVRIWALNPPYPDTLYDWFDDRGILVWQDFPTGSRLPDSEEFRDIFSQEAEHMVRRLRHHPSIYIWCGGNENMYMNDVWNSHNQTGFDILYHDFRMICENVDPDRYYHTSCPSQGRYPNDPLFGDSHGSRAMRCYCPGEMYGAYFTENIRVYPPQINTFRRWLGDKFWDEDFIDIRPFGCLKPMPRTWQALVRNHGEEKFGPIGDFYSASNAQELIYKYTQAAGQDIYQMFARARRGNPVGRSTESPFSQGFMIWKINDPWPNFYCSLIDYYGEPSLVYYVVKRSVSPVWIDFEIGDHIWLWGVNDTRTAVNATLEIYLYNMENESVSVKDEMPIVLNANQSRVLLNLDRYGYLRWTTLLYAHLKDNNDNIIVKCNQFLTRENMLVFHEAEIYLNQVSENTLEISTNVFARCVELSGGENGEDFGWRFDDNYFDLFPFETRKIKVIKTGSAGCIRAKAQYSPHITIIEWGK